MVLKYLDKRTIGGYIIDAWQNHLNTEMDPANGQWFTNDPKNTGGLYGSLTDQLAGQLEFDMSAQLFNPRSIILRSVDVDNRKGTQEVTQTVGHTFQYQDTTAVTHSTTNAIKVGLQLSAKTTTKVGDAKSEGGEVGSEKGGTFTFEYSYSWTDATTVTKSAVETFNEQIQVKVAPGKASRAVLLASDDELSLPFSANIYLVGLSTATFASAVNGKNSWVIDAGTLCSLIQLYGSAGNESYMYGRNPKDPTQGMITLKGNLLSKQTTNIHWIIEDVTDKLN